MLKNGIPGQTPSSSGISRTKRANHCEIVFVLDKQDPRQCDQFEKNTGHHIRGTLNPCPPSGCPQRWPDNTCRTADHGIEMNEVPLNFCDIKGRNILRYTRVNGKCAIREFTRNGDSQFTTKKACLDKRRKRGANKRKLYVCLPTCAKQKAGKGVCKRIPNRNGWNTVVKICHRSVVEETRGNDQFTDCMKKHNNNHEKCQQFVTKEADDGDDEYDYEDNEDYADEDFTAMRIPDEMNAIFNNNALSCTKYLEQQHCVQIHDRVLQPAHSNQVLIYS
uniref:Uncharacterized protein n=1 Tax=Romanomermis culicivorax TaxID=13658 RepID=A0A915JC09_ROMCU